MSEHSQKIAFIVNPISGGKSKKIIPLLIESKLDKNKFSPQIYYTNRRNHGKEITQELLAKGIKKIVAVGGDGTVNEVASALVNTEGVLGIIPFGSGNGLARHLNIPMDISKAMDVINKGYQIKMDSGQMNDISFFCTSGIGFDAFIGEKFAQQSERGFKTYIKTSIYEFFQYKPSSYKLTFPDKIIETDAFLITIGNTSQYGNNAFICPYADVQDGLLDVSIIIPFPKLIALDLGRRLFSKTIDRSRYTKVFQTTELKINRHAPGPVHIDGEPMEMGEEIALKIIPQSLNVIVAK